MMNVWENIIGCPLNRKSRVSANHFKPSDITSTWESGDSSSQISVCPIEIIYDYLIQSELM